MAAVPMPNCPHSSLGESSLATLDERALNVPPHEQDDLADPNPVDKVRTMLDAMRRTAVVSSDKGVRFHTSLHESERATYSDLDDRAKHDAVLLWRSGLKPGDRVVLAYDAGLEFLRALYATTYAGLVIVPAPVSVAVDAGTLWTRITDIVHDSGSRAVLASSKIVELFASFDAPCAMVTLPADQTNFAELWTDPGIEPSDVALIQYTSGSTGSPTGVIVSHSNLVANQTAMATVTRSGEDPVVLGWLPHYHDMGLIGLYLQPVFAGYDLVLTSPSQFLRRPALWLQLITRYRATTTVAPDFAYNLCAKVVAEDLLGELDLSSLRVVITGAEPVRIATLNRFADRFAKAGFDPQSFVPAYGMAETTLLVTAKPTGDTTVSVSLDLASLQQGVVATAATGPTVELISCGPVAPGHRIAIVETGSMTSAAPDTIGEIWVTGPSVAQGYWANPGKTAEAFGWKLPGDAGAYLRTGDLGFFHDTGLVITGRIKDLIIVRGRNIYPTDIETEVASGLSAAVSTGSAAFEWDDGHVVVVVELRKDVDPTHVDFVRRAVAVQFSLEPLGLVVVRPGSIPRTTSGKIQRQLTRARLAEGKVPVLLSSGVTLPRPFLGQSELAVER
jgi:acyl-CoA synthetase (AMP-forming)/AMP-acid ligase II